MKKFAIGIILIATLTGCSSQQVIKVAHNDTLIVPIHLGNQADSGDAIHQMWVSFASPDFLVFQATSSVLGPRRVEIGESWEAIGRFSISTSAPLGCTALAYSISTSSEDATFPSFNDEPPTIMKLLITPEKHNFWQRIRELPQKAVCVLRKQKSNVSWSWVNSPPAPRTPHIISPKRNIPLTPDPMPLVGLPRGDFGFVIGSSLYEADENAKSRGLWPGTNVTAKPVEWRYFEVTRDPEISAITMHFTEEMISQLNVSYGDGPSATYERLQIRLRRKLGKEAASSSGESYWSDGHTVIVLRDRQIEYHDLNGIARLRFTKVGGGPSFYFFPGKGYVESRGPNHLIDQPAAR